jgi:hypothetical protein
MTDLAPTPPILALDPGYLHSTAILYSSTQRRVLAIWRERPNAEMLDWLEELSREGLADKPLVIEWAEGMGQTAGIELLDACRWAGKFEHAYRGPIHLMHPGTVKSFLCGTRAVKRTAVHRVLLDKFGPEERVAKGTKKSPGPLYGIGGDHCWAALALAVTFAEQGPER